MISSYETFSFFSMEVFGKLLYLFVESVSKEFCCRWLCE